MIDKTKLKTAQEWVEKLANGINPLTSEPVKEDDIVNNVHISRCLFFVSEMLKKVKTTEYSSDGKKPFMITSQEAEKIAISAPCGIAQFMRAVNEGIPEDMKQLSTTSVIKWLRNNGYLYEVSKDGKHKTNLPTEKGNQIGITVRSQQNLEGQEFQQVVYDATAQRFILRNIGSIASI